MGTDINGWVEIRQNNTWRGAIKVGNLVGRNYDMFSSLFGVTAYAQFNPIAKERGLPMDISEDASDDYLTWDSIYGETWISWSDIQSIDWEETAWCTRQGSMTSRDATLEQASGWKVLLQLTETVAIEYGADNVRMVIWFDH